MIMMKNLVFAGKIQDGFGSGIVLNLTMCDFESAAILVLL